MIASLAHGLVWAMCLLSFACNAAAADLAISSGPVRPGGAVTLLVKLASQTQQQAVAALQFDIDYDASLSLDVRLGEAAEAAGKTLFSAPPPVTRVSNPIRGRDLRRPAPLRHLRVLIAGLNQLSIADGVVLALECKLSSTASAGVISITMSNLTAVSPDAVEESLSNVNRSGPDTAVLSPCRRSRESGPNTQSRATGPFRSPTCFFDTAHLL